MINVEVTNQQSALCIASGTLQQAVEIVLRGEGIRAATVSLAVVDDATIQPLNERYLRHDYATDVLSFLLERDADALEGEVIVSAETAMRAAGQYGWSADRELLLYVVHGTLHLVGYDDQATDDQQRMRAKENEYLGKLQDPPYEK